MCKSYHGLYSFKENYIVEVERNVATNWENITA